MSRRRPRGLTEEERELWQRVREKTVPLHPERPHPLRQLPASVQKADTAKATLPVPAAEPIQPFRIGALAGETGLGHGYGQPGPPAAAPAMDKKHFARLRRGKLTPEAKIDLHGMTLAQAHPALNRFVLGAHARGLRLILVITGKGRDDDDTGPMPARRGIMRQQLPHWLASPGLAPAVLQVAEAHQRHGGGGAFYVYLRRKR